MTHRTEPVSKMSEHAIAQIGSIQQGSTAKKVKVEDLLKEVSLKPRMAKLTNAVKQAKKKARTLQAPLEKPQALRVLFGLHAIAYSYSFIKSWSWISLD